MGANSKIEWTDHTFNPWSGCTKVHAGCANCYAEVNYSVRMRGVKWGPNGTRVKTADWSGPRKWNRQAEKEGVRRRVFCASLADVFEDWQGHILDHEGNVMWNTPRGVRGAGATTLGCQLGERPATMDDLRRDLFVLIDATPWLDWLLLTKRPENVRGMMPRYYPCEHKRGCHDCDANGAARPNVWIGTSISDQATANGYAPKLRALRDLAPVLFLSIEPLLGPIDCDERWDLSAFDWVIVGGESGRHARACDVAWVRSIRDQCKAAEVPVFIKQLGATIYDKAGKPQDWMKLGVKEIVSNNWLMVTPCDSKGGNWVEWPDDLRIREFPEFLAHV